MSAEENLAKFCDTLIDADAHYDEDHGVYYKLYGMTFFGYPVYFRTAFTIENCNFKHLYNFSPFTITDLDTKESQPVPDGMDGILRHLKSIYLGDLE
jgi:hypothetical protein